MIELSAVTKTIVNVATLIVAVGTPLLSYTTGLLPEKYALWISAIVALAGAIVHYLAPNVTDDPVVAEHQSVRLNKKPRKRAVKKVVARKPVIRPAD